MPDELSVLITVRHGFGTTPLTVDSVYENTTLPVKIVFVDPCGPASVARHFEQLERSRDDFTYLRVDEHMHRQDARSYALPHIDTEFAVLLDNNTLCAPNTLDTLVAAQADSGADVVSPIIVTQGGRVHFSAGTIIRERKPRSIRREVRRSHCTDDAQVPHFLDETNPKQMSIDFAESHMCMLRTDDLRIPGVINADMRNAHTTAAATYTLKYSHGRSMMIEPAAVASILPFAFGYDIPWLCESYMRRDWIVDSYRNLGRLIGRGLGSSAAANLGWHKKHFQYLLLSMLDDDRLSREDFVRADEVPSYIDGYDLPLPANAEERIRVEVLPSLRDRYPEHSSVVEDWLDLVI